jgi:putative DNA primase/helicase
MNNYIASLESLQRQIEAVKHDDTVLNNMSCTISNTVNVNKLYGLPLKLQYLLSHIVKINFKEYFFSIGLEKYGQKDYLVVIIEKLFEIVDKHGFDLAKQGECIYFFNSEYWELMDKDTIKKFLVNSAIKQGVAEITVKGYEYQERLLKQFLVTNNIQAVEGNKNNLINLLNGTFDIDNGGKIRAFNKSDFLTYQLPFNYDVTANASKFIKFLDEVLPDKNVQMSLQEYCGYIFIKSLKLEKVLILFGSGANGKSVFVDILSAIFGRHNMTNYSLSDLNEEHNRAKLNNMSINWGHEINSTQINLDIFKTMSSGEPISARFKYGNSFIMTSYAKLAFNANKLPRDVEHNEAFYRRFLIIPFDVTIPVERRNPTLAEEIIKDELSGVLNWMLDGMRRLIKNRCFTDSSTINEVIENYKKINDTVALFIQEQNYKKTDNKLHKRSLCNIG